MLLVTLYPGDSPNPRLWMLCHTGTCCCCLVAQSCPTLRDPTDCNPPGCSVHGISQARILEWVAISFSRGSSQPRDQTRISCISGGFFYCWPLENLLRTSKIVFQDGQFGGDMRKVDYCRDRFHLKATDSWHKTASPSIHVCLSGLTHTHHTHIMDKLTGCSQTREPHLFGFPLDVCTLP